MSDTPKFTVVDRRKFRAEDDTMPNPEPKTAAPSAVSAELVAEPAGKPAPRLTLVEPLGAPVPSAPAIAVAEEEPEGIEEPEAAFDESQLPPAPTPEQARFQKTAYEQSAERLDNLVRAQNPGAPAQEKIGFEHLVQQLYLSAMMQMGAGTPEGQRPRIDILGARQTIDLLAVVQEKTHGNLSAEETRTLDTVLYELRMTFLELTRMISAKPAAPMPPPPGNGHPGARR